MRRRDAAERVRHPEPILAEIHNGYRAEPVHVQEEVTELPATRFRSPPPPKWEAQERRAETAWMRAEIDELNAHGRERGIGPKGAGRRACVPARARS